MSPKHDVRGYNRDIVARLPPQSRSQLVCYYEMSRNGLGTMSKMLNPVEDAREMDILDMPWLPITKRLSQRYSVRS